MILLSDDDVPLAEDNREEVSTMTVNIKRSYLIVVILTTVISATLAVQITDYVRDHGEMRRTIVEQKQLIQVIEETKDVHEENAELLKEDVEGLKQIPVK